jgi:hypothetical protein
MTATIAFKGVTPWCGLFPASPAAPQRGAGVKIPGGKAVPEL